jgi:hypothetical protein
MRKYNFLSLPSDQWVNKYPLSTTAKIKTKSPSNSKRISYYSILNLISFENYINSPTTIVTRK